MKPSGPKTSLTKPKSPTLHTNKRLQFKEDLMNSAEKSQCSEYFKARPMNKKIFEAVSKLPEIEKKGKTEFE